MDWNALRTLWFCLISVLFIGYFFLEGFDFGVGILLPFLGRDDRDRRVILGSIGPHWDGNEVWLIVAGGATFAAFPSWYATLFSGFYLALLLVLLALIVRAVAFEFRSKEQHPAWRSVWDGLIFAGSLVPALLWGVALANLLRGVPIDDKLQYVGGFWNLLNPYALLGGLVSLSLFILHGAIFLDLKVYPEIGNRARKVAAWGWLPATVLMLAFLIVGGLVTDLFKRHAALPWLLSIGTLLALLEAGWLVRARRLGWAFGFAGLAIVLWALTLFTGLYPRLIVSSLDPNNSLTIYNASSTQYSLSVMSIVAAVLVPIVLVYQVWGFWVFRKRIGREDTLEY